MSFKFYKFCQSGFITVLCSAFSLFYSLSISGNFIWWLGIIISICVTLFCFIPPFGIFYPIIFGIFILISLIKSYIEASLFFWPILFVFVLHIVRFVSIFTFSRSNPEKSLQYDEAIRYGVEPK